MNGACKTKNNYKKIVSETCDGRELLFEPCFTFCVYWHNKHLYFLGEALMLALQSTKTDWIYLNQEKISRAFNN